MPGLHIALLQVLGDGLPVALAGGVALDDLVGNGPAFQPAAPGPDGDLPPVALYVDPSGKQQRAGGHAAQGVVFGPGL